MTYHQLNSSEKIQLLKYDEDGATSDEDEVKCCLVLCVCPWNENKLKKLLTRKLHGNAPTYSHGIPQTVSMNKDTKFPPSEPKISSIDNDQKSHEDDSLNFSMKALSALPRASYDYGGAAMLMVTKVELIDQTTQFKMWPARRGGNSRKLRLINSSSKKLWMKWEDNNFNCVLGAVSSSGNTKCFYISAQSTRLRAVLDDSIPATFNDEENDSRIFRRLRSRYTGAAVLQHIVTNLFIGRDQRRRNILTLVEEEYAISWSYVFAS